MVCCKPSNSHGQSGPAHIVHSRPYNILGGLEPFRCSFGDYAQSERLLSELHGKDLVEDDPLRLTCITRLAITYKQQCRYQEAEAMMKQVVEVRARTLEDGDADLLQSKTNLASVFVDQRRFDEAEAILEEVRTAKIRALGSNHRGALRSTAELADVYLRQGLWNRAEQLLSSVAAISKRELGNDDEETLSIERLWTYALGMLGRHEEAERVLLRLVNSRMQSVGQEHPETLACMWTLANTYCKQRRTPRDLDQQIFPSPCQECEEARQLASEIFCRAPKVLGEKHGIVIYGVAELAATLLEAEQFEQAEKWLKLALDVRQEALGPDHPDAIVLTYHLAMAFVGQGRAEEAAHFMDKATDGALRRPGGRHPATLACHFNPGVTRRLLGGGDEAEAIWARILPDMEQILGPQHVRLAVDSTDNTGVVDEYVDWQALIDNEAVPYGSVHRSRAVREDNPCGFSAPRTAISRRLVGSADISPAFGGGYDDVADTVSDNEKGKILATTPT
ncbi:hypothetical protein CLIM01_13482 [Colletotrichum limetticola]|uniref:Kinesin light chain n=1 Tax=Colletotrichum limetticola TaxID=1209924 RepID=A0ABQ9PGV9_9PEZI|nr:hypothetical protein CLIM01_13482 [Colletotrichum limetticola]